MIYLCDFEDSFTYNIYSEVLELGLKIEVISYKKINRLLERVLPLGEKFILILGPGPGHPSDYHEIKEKISKLMENENIMLFGICLGHQLICEALGLSVERALVPKHGESIELNLKEDEAKIFSLPQKLSVQRYNSLAVLQNIETEKIITHLGLEAFFHEKELMLLKGERFISYQFHPESVGTTYRSRFFRALHNF